MKRTKKFLLLLGAAFALILVHNGCILFFDPPGEAAHAKAHELGWAESDIVVASAEYSSALIGWTSSLRFRSKSEPERGEIVVSVRKPTVLHSWELAEYSPGDR